MREYRFSLTRIFPYTGKHGLEKTRILAYFTPWIFCSGIAIDDMHIAWSFLFTRVTFTCDLGQLASFSNVRNTSGGVLCKICNFNKNSTPLQLFFMFLNENNRPKLRNTLYICFQELFFFFKRNHYKNRNMKTWMSSLSLRIYFMCLIFDFSLGDLIETWFLFSIYCL